ncbi:hypothetical protein GQ457_02G042940 [Hibiscus cannabinus]
MFWVVKMIILRLTGFTTLEGYFDVIGSILEVGNDILLLGNGWKQWKPVWMVRMRNWKLQGGENQLSGLLEGVSMVHGYEWYNEGMRSDAMRLACMRNDAMRLACMRNDATRLAWMRNDATRLAWMRNDATRFEPMACGMVVIASVGKARRQGGSNITFVQV